MTSTVSKQWLANVALRYILIALSLSFLVLLFLFLLGRWILSSLFCLSGLFDLLLLLLGLLSGGLICGGLIGCVLVSLALLVLLGFLDLGELGRFGLDGLDGLFHGVHVLLGQVTGIVKLQSVLDLFLE